MTAPFHKGAVHVIIGIIGLFIQAKKEVTALVVLRAVISNHT